MKLEILTFLTFLLASGGGATNNKIPLYESKIRRSGVSYSTSVIHKDSRYPDQHAQSTIDFKLGTGSSHPLTSVSDDVAAVQLKPSVYQYTTPKSVKDYKQSPFQVVPKFPVPKHTFLNYHQNYPQQQSQSFNVGYSVKFGNDRKRKQQQQQQQLSYEPDVITGSHKEEVKNPFEGQVFYNQNWKNLSPTVEIYRSKEIDVDKFQPVNFRSSFDHQRALGKSVGFDYSNAVDLQNAPTVSHKKTKLDLSSLPTVSYAKSPVKLGGEYSAEIKKPKFPLDTSLLRDPVLTTKGAMSVNAKQIPIHFDTTLIQQMGKQIKEQQQQLNTQQFNNLLSEGAEAQSQQQQQQLLQPHLHNNVKMYLVNEHVEESQASQPQPAAYRVFAKPANEFMRHEFEKSAGSGSNSSSNNSNNSSSPKKEGRLRQARIQPKRVVRHFGGMERDLKPPPYANYYIRNRRVHY